MVNVNGNEVSMDAAVMLMDDEIREAVNFDIAPCREQEFVDEYCKRHLEKYGEDFIVTQPLKPLPLGMWSVNYNKTANMLTTINILNKGLELLED